MIDGDAVVHELDLAAAPEIVFEHFVDPAKLVRWIGISATLEPRPGGTFRFEVVPGEHCEGNYVEVDPPRTLVFTWGWTNPGMGVAPGTSTVEVRLVPHSGGTRLLLVHRGLGGGRQRDMHDEGWTRFLGLLGVAVGHR